MCTSDLHKLAKDQRDEIADIRKRLLDSQQAVINLQKQKLQEKSETVSEMKDVVKAKLKSYRPIAALRVRTSLQAATIPKTSTAQLRKMVKATVEEEERSRNVVVFGLKEESVK